MRKYATVPPSIWQADLKKLRGNADAIATYYHLTTSPHSTMIGLYHLPLMYLAYEIGIGLEGASKGLRSVCEAGLATYDEQNEIVWVHEMAASQVAPRLSPKDNRVSSVGKQLSALPICPITLSFYRHYGEAFHLRDQPVLEEFERALLSSGQAPSKPLRSKEQKQEQDLGEGTGESCSERRKDTYPHEKNNDDEQEDPFDPPATLDEGRGFIVSLGVPEQFREPALQRHMRGMLYPCDVEQWKVESRGAA